MNEITQIQQSDAEYINELEFQLGNAMARIAELEAQLDATELGPQEPPQNPMIFNRRQADGTFRPLSQFFDAHSANQQIDAILQTPQYDLLWA